MLPRDMNHLETTTVAIGAENGVIMVMVIATFLVGLGRVPKARIGRPTNSLATASVVEAPATENGAILL